MNSSVFLSCDEHVPHHLDEHVKGQGPRWPSMHEYLECYSRLLSSPIRAPSLHPMSAPLYYVVKSTPRILYLPAHLQLVSALQKVSGKRWAKVALCKRVSVMSRNFWVVALANGGDKIFSRVTDRSDISHRSGRKASIKVVHRVPWNQPHEHGILEEFAFLVWWVLSCIT